MLDIKDIKVQIVKEVKRSDGLWRCFSLYQVYSGHITDPLEARGNSKEQKTRI